MFLFYRNSVSPSNSLNESSTEKSPGKELLDKIFKANIFSALTTANNNNINKPDYFNLSDKNNANISSTSDLDLKQFKLSELGSIFSKLTTTTATTTDAHKKSKATLSSSCNNCKLSKIECKCKFNTSSTSSSSGRASGSTQEYVNNVHSMESLVSYEEKSKENVNRDLSQLLSDIKNMKTLAAHRKSSSEHHVNLQHSPADDVKPSNSHQMNRSRINIVNT